MVTDTLPVVSIDDISILNLPSKKVTSNYKTNLLSGTYSARGRSLQSRPSINHVDIFAERHDGRKMADISPLLDVEDMVRMKSPDWKCVFTYVQMFYRRFALPPKQNSSVKMEMETNAANYAGDIGAEWLKTLSHRSRCMLLFCPPADSSSGRNQCLKPMSHLQFYRAIYT